MLQKCINIFDVLLFSVPTYYMYDLDYIYGVKGYKHMSVLNNP